MSTIDPLTPSEAVEKLGLEPFITKNRKEIAERLLSICRSAKEHGDDAQLVFIAESMPLMNAIVQLGSTQESYSSVVRLIHSRPVRSAPMCILAALVFIYLVEVSLKDYEPSSQDEAIAWNRIRRWEEHWREGQTGGPV